MRLINIATLKLEQFSEKNIPPYAILSHTWGKSEEELSFRQLEEGTFDKSSLGWTKLEGTCRQAEKDRLSYAWIDTCCIDKSQGDEHSESINSMYRWYRQAAVCYVFLTDVPATDDPLTAGSHFRKSRWFTRGWTLQELLAPQTLRFYNADWQCVGNKAKMCTLIMEITGIPRSILLGINDLHEASVAQRMSWAARRQTTVAEDMAYCLLGIFGVMMPMDYDEGGPQAFYRLQDRITKSIDDDSIFAWGMGDARPEMEGRALATHPLDFAQSGDIVPRHGFKELSLPEVLEGRIHLHLPLVPVDSEHGVGLLNCGPTNDPQSVVGIPLIKTGSDGAGYVRPVGGLASLVQIPSPLPPFASFDIRV